VNLTGRPCRRLTGRGGSPDPPRCSQTRWVRRGCCPIQPCFRVVAFPGHHAPCTALAAAWEGRRAGIAVVTVVAVARWVRRPTAQKDAAARRGLQACSRVVAFQGHHALCTALAAAWDGRRAGIAVVTVVAVVAVARWVRRPTAQEDAAARRGLQACSRVVAFQGHHAKRCRGTPRPTCRPASYESGSTARCRSSARWR